MSGKHWSDAENDRIVDAHLAMLREELAGRPVNKAAYNRALQQRIGRSHGSIEYKHRNVSAVLSLLGQPRLSGYFPAENFQDSLFDAVLRRLEAEPEELRPTPPARRAAGRTADATLELVPPPTLRNRPDTTHDRIRRFLGRFDMAGRDAANRDLGRAGEELVLAHERAALRRNDRNDLADRVRWVSAEEGDGAGYDIHSWSPEGQPRLLEVKTTRGSWEGTPFHISRNELARSEAEPALWRLFRLYDFAGNPRAFELCPPLERHVRLLATSYEARFCKT